MTTSLFTICDALRFSRMRAMNGIMRERLERRVAIAA
jgi:hypothetical protein